MMGKLYLVANIQKYENAYVFDIIFTCQESHRGNFWILITRTFLLENTHFF